MYGYYKLGVGDEGSRGYFWMNKLQLQEAESVSEEALDEARRAYRAAEDALLE